MDNVQNCDNYINIPSSQTCVSYQTSCFSNFLISVINKPRQTKSKPLTVAWTTNIPTTWKVKSVS
jgi:hypothetical protein